MDIILQGADSFKIKTKTATIEIGENIKLTNNSSGVTKEVTGPGEYEIMGISIIGYKNNIYVYEFEKLRLCSTPKDLINDIGDIDILLLSNASKEVVEHISEIEPYFVITPNADALKDSGIPVENMPKFSLKREDILEDQNTKVIILEKK